MYSSLRQRFQHYRGGSCIFKVEPGLGMRAMLLRSSELARQVGVSRQVVHEYTTLGLIVPARRTTGGHRLYDESAVRRLHLIRDLIESGYTLRDIRATFFRRPRG